MKLLTSVMLVLFCLLSVSLHAQDRKKMITGIILSDNDQQPVEGVSVQVKGTKNISGSQADGIFYISVTPADKILVIRHPGYETQEVILTEETEYNIILKEVAR